VSLPLKDLGRLGVCERTHDVLSRVARYRGVTLQELAREILDQYVADEIHRANVVIGRDYINPSDTDSHGASRNGGRR
jgi:hypothetical protein